MNKIIKDKVTSIALSFLLYRIVSDDGLVYLRAILSIK